MLSQWSGSMIFCGRAPEEARDCFCCTWNTCRMPVRQVFFGMGVNFYATSAAMPATGLKTMPGKSV